MLVLYLLLKPCLSPSNPTTLSSPFLAAMAPTSQTSNDFPGDRLPFIETVQYHRRASDSPEEESERYTRGFSLCLSTNWTSNEASLFPKAGTATFTPTATSIIVTTSSVSRLRKISDGRLCCNMLWMLGRTTSRPSRTTRISLASHRTGSSLYRTSANQPPS